MTLRAASLAIAIFIITGCSSDERPKSPAEKEELSQYFADLQRATSAQSLRAGARTAPPVGDLDATLAFIGITAEDLALLEGDLEAIQPPVALHDEHQDLIDAVGDSRTTRLAIGAFSGQTSTQELTDLLAESSEHGNRVAKACGRLGQIADENNIALQPLGCGQLLGPPAR